MQALIRLSLTQTYRDHTEWVTAVAWSPHDDEVRAPDGDKTVTTWIGCCHSLDEQVCENLYFRVPLTPAVLALGILDGTLDSW